MKTFLSITGYTWAVLCLIILPVTFVANNQFATKLAQMPFMKVNPKYTGGDPAFTLEKNACRITVNKPVFEALIGQSRRGFVQVKWSAENGLPAFLHDSIDYDADGTADFVADIHTVTGESVITPLDRHVLGLGISSMVKQDWVVRVNLKRKLLPLRK